MTLRILRSKRNDFARLTSSRPLTTTTTSYYNQFSKPIISLPRASLLYNKNYYATMATSSKIVIPANRSVVGTGVSGIGQTPESAAEVSRLLQENHDTHHIYFNDEGFHNHIVHHLLALYSFGAAPQWLKQGYDNNSTYQRPLGKEDEKIVEQLLDESKFEQHLGDEKRYTEYLRYFQREMEKNDWRDVVKKYLFDDSKLANDMLARLFAGFLHPFIHLGYGVEHEQPAIIAEALAQTAIHDTWTSAFLNTCDEKSGGKSTKTLVDLIKECQETKELQGAAKFEDPHKNKGLMKRAGDTMIQVASQWGVHDEKELEQKAAEVVNMCGYMTGAAQRPDKEIKMDFFLMHAINSSLWLSTFINQPWIPTPAKMKLVAWHGRLSLNLYVSRGNPKLNINEIANYTPRDNSTANPWLGVVDRGIKFGDDGHCVKFIRACANGERVTRGYEGKDGFIMVGDLWIKLANMVIDSAESGDRKTVSTWVRSAGFDEAWKDIGGRKEYKGKL